MNEENTSSLEKEESIGIRIAASCMEKKDTINREV